MEARKLQFVEAEAGVSVAVAAGRVYVVSRAFPRTGKAQAVLTVVVAGTGASQAFFAATEQFARDVAGEMALLRETGEGAGRTPGAGPHKRTVPKGEIVPFVAGGG